MKPAYKISVFGISIDLGLFAETHCLQKPCMELWVFLGKLLPRILLWIVSQALCYLLHPFDGKKRREKRRLYSHKIFAYLISDKNPYQHAEGLLHRIDDILHCPIQFQNFSVIGNSLRLVHKNKASFPVAQDLIIIHVGAMDWYNKVSLESLQGYMNEILTEMGRKSPNAHICFLGPADLVDLVANPATEENLLPLPFSPSIHQLQKWEGFHTYMDINSRSPLEKLEWAKRYLEDCIKIFKTELQKAKDEKRIASYSFIDTVEFYHYIEAKHDRFSFAAIDGLHPTALANVAWVDYYWPKLSRDLLKTEHFLRFAKEEHQLGEAKKRAL